MKFDENYYKSKNPDLVAANVDLMWHYKNHGKKEGRTGAFDLSRFLVDGGLKLATGKQNILVVCHESSLTGAPILGLDLVIRLSESCNVITWLGKDGPLLEKFKEHSCKILTNFPDRVDCEYIVKELKNTIGIDWACLNSVATYPVAPAIYLNKIPSIGLIHEYAEYMEEAVLALMLQCNYVVVPSSDVRSSAESAFEKRVGSKPLNLRTKHQGKCDLKHIQNNRNFSKNEILNILNLKHNDLSDKLIVLGCGHVQIRKGLEYFVHAAEKCLKKGQDCIFIWVGDGYDPDVDLNYSSWIRSQIKLMGLESTVIFFKSVSDLNPFFELADVFFLSSRLDPFPNVAIDSIVNRVPVVAFKNGTGFCDFIEKHSSVGAFVPYLNDDEAAEALIKFGKKKDAINELFEAAIDDLDQNKYVEYIKELALEAVEQQTKLEAVEIDLINSEILDRKFFRSSFPVNQWFDKLSEEYLYLTNWVRGVRNAKSSAGFNDCYANYMLQMKGLEFFVPAQALLMNAIPLKTHNHIEYDINKTVKKDFPKIAVHIHCYNINGLYEILMRFGCVANHCDFYITTDTALKSIQIKQVFLKAEKSHQHTICFKISLVPNIGRDVGPFIMLYQSVLNTYDIIGHFHLKGTKEIAETELYQWQNFMLNTLIGERGEVASFIFTKFIKDDKLGMVFAEDPCVPSWGLNKQICSNLTNKIDVAMEPVLTAYPTGNMFWIKSAAYKHLLNKNWAWSDFPKEPVGYDGTLLHAIERIGPLICKSAGLQWATISVPGVYRYSN